MKQYSDNVILAYTGYIRGFGYTLTKFDANGEETQIAEDVTQYIRVDESTILYLSDGELYLYDLNDGEEAERIAKEVDYFWSIKEMAVSNTF